MVKATIRTALIVLMLPSMAAAQVAVPLEHDGRPGVWFELDEARRLNALDSTLAMRARELHLLERQLELAVEFEIPALRRAVQATQEIGETWAGVVETATTRAREAEERADAWHTRPLLWVLIGLAVGGLLGGFIVSR